MTKKQSKQTPIMRSTKKGYVLTSYREILSLYMTVDYMAGLLSQAYKSGEYKPGKLDVIKEIRKVIWSSLNKDDDEIVEQRVNEMIDQLANPDIWEKVDK